MGQVRITDHDVSDKLLLKTPTCHSTSSEVASVLEASTVATSLSGSSAATKLTLASSATASQAAASFRRRASRVGFLLGRQGGLAFLLVLLQQLGSLLLLQFSIDDLIKTLPLLGQGVESWNGRSGKIQKETTE